MNKLQIIILFMGIFAVTAQAATTTVLDLHMDEGSGVVAFDATSSNRSGKRNISSE